MKCEVVKSTAAHRDLVLCQESTDSIAVIAPTIALIALVYTVVNQIFERAAARRKATLDMISQEELSAAYSQANRCFSQHRRGGTLLSLSKPATAAATKDRQTVLRYLNHYELISLGIRRKRYDDEFYREWMKTAFVRDWNAAGDFIQGERWRWDDDARQWHYDERAYQHFEHVATSWSGQARQLRFERQTPPATPPATAQIATAGSSKAVERAWPRPFFSFFTPKG